MSNVLIVYHSCSGRTKSVADVISKVLDALVVSVDDFNIDKFKKADIVGFGSGIYYSRHHKKLLGLVKELPEIEKKVFIFSTSGFGNTVFHRVLFSLL